VILYQRFFEAAKIDLSESKAHIR